MTTPERIRPTTRAAIAEAIEALTSSGEVDVSNDDLARLAGIGRATLYNAFRLAPDLRAMWTEAKGRSPAAVPDEAAELRAQKKALRAENKELRERLDAYATVAYALDAQRRLESEAGGGQVSRIR